MKKGHGRFWDEWDGWNDSQETSGPRRGRRGGPRSERAQHWRQHFNRYMGVFPEDHWLVGGRRFRPWHRGRPDFNPFVANLMSHGGGLLPVLVLQFIAEEPRYGNEVMKLIRQKTAGQWLANPGAIYPLLNQLEEAGFITGEWEDDRKRTTRIYQITPEGEKELERLKEILKPKLSEAIAVLQDLEDELNGKHKEV